MADPEATIREKRRISPIWIVPIVALAIGIYMVVWTIQRQGPEITITFRTASGLEAGNTKIKLRDVQVGLVESVGLGDDLETVIVTASLDREAAPLLREDTDFWVVRPRIGRGGVSGLQTVLSGAYIQISPGSARKKSKHFVGLEEPPVTPAGTPGKQLTILADRAGSVGVGDPILYKGFRVGSVETREFDVETRSLRYRIFIEAPYDDLVTTTTRFWEVSGISVTAGADGIQASIGSLESLIIGGVEFGLPKGIDRGSEVETGAIFQLYESYAKVNERPHLYGIEYVVEFTRSVRGLEAGAPVEYRGLPVGRVERVMLAELSGERGGGRGNPIPVLIRLEPARLELPDSPEGIHLLRRSIRSGVEAGGLRASLATGSLLTGSLYVAFDFYPDEPQADLGIYQGRPSIPTVASGFGGLEQRITALLDKLNALPLDDTLGEVEAMLASLNALVSSKGMQSLPASLDATMRDLQRTLASVSGDSELQARLLPLLAELDQTLASMKRLADTLSEQPNALLFNRATREDPRPPAGAP
jgi:paraquat-inducible protein B